MSTHNVCFRGEIREILCGYLLCPLIWSYAFDSLLMCLKTSCLAKSVKADQMLYSDQHSHSHFDLGVHVPLGFSIWGYRSLFEGTHIFG